MVFEDNNKKKNNHYWLCIRYLNGYICTVFWNKDLSETETSINQSYMKKVFLAVFVLALPVALSAQEKGDMFISGNFTIDAGGSKSTTGNVSVKNPSPLTFEIAPQFGYFVVDRLEVDLALGYSLTRTKTGTDADGNNLFRRNNVFEISPGVRYYLPLGEKFYYTPGFSFEVGFGGTSTDLSQSSSTKNGLTTFGFSLSALAFEFRPVEHIGVTFRAGALSYSMEHSSDKNANSSTNENSFSFNLNRGVSLGLKYYF